MVLVIRVADCLQKFRITADAANVLGRSAALACDTGGIDSARVGGHRLFEYDLVPPIIAEIVIIADRDANREREISQPDRAFIDDGFFVFRIGFAIALTAQAEFMQVAILPFHHGLNHLVQLLES